MLNNASNISANNYWQRSRFIERALFLLIVLIEAGIFLYLIWGRWVVGGHDGFKYFYLQYYFLNNVVNYGEIPQWCPFLTHGAVTTWWYIYQGGILQNILLLSGSLLKSVNFLPIFYSGIFVDHLLLLVGVWFLGKRFYSSPFTLFFVSLSIMGSCVWLLQTWWNFHFFYAIPLTLYFVHRFLDTGKWRYCFLAGNLLLIQSLGGLPYFLPVTTLVITLYFMFYGLFHFRETLQAIRGLRFGLPFVLTTAVIGFSFIALYFAMGFGTDLIKNYLHRNPDGSVPLDVFLTYGGQLSWKAWLELLLGVSPCLDYSLYAGIVLVPFVLVGTVFNLNKNNIHFLLALTVLLFFSMGTFISVFFYYSWPFMNYFRHLALISPIIKILLCFLAGFGFDAVFFTISRWKKPLAIKVTLASMSVFMIGIFLALRLLSEDYEFSCFLIRGIMPEKLYPFAALFNKEIMTSLLNRTALFALAASILFAALPFLINRKRYLLPLAIIVLLLHGADIYGFKFSEIRLKAAPLNDEISKIIDFQAMPYAERRNVAFDNNNPRARLLDVLPIKNGAFYWTTHALLFSDELGNPFKTDHLLSPLDQYMEIYWGQPIEDLSMSSDRYRIPHMKFPKWHPAVLKISGVTEDKIQLFSQAEVVSSDDAIIANIIDANYSGDRVFLSPLDESITLSPAILVENLGKDLSVNKRLHFPYQVNRFDSNNIVITTDVNDLESAWLFYSDVWHPFWRATVNGRETPVYKANLAYKAVKLEKGFNEVHFYFKSRFMSFLQYVFGLNSLFWLLVIVFLSGKIIFHGPRERTAPMV